VVETVIADEDSKLAQVKVSKQNLLRLIAGVLQFEGVYGLACRVRYSLPEVSLERQADASQKEIVLVRI